jgi:hypothetical protein
MSEEDPRCCGSGTCIIDAESRCWCGQQWDGQKMCHVPLAAARDAAPSPASTGSGMAGSDAHDTPA